MAVETNLRVVAASLPTPPRIFHSAILQVSSKMPRVPCTSRNWDRGKQTLTALPVDFPGRLDLASCERKIPLVVALIFLYVLVCVFARGPPLSSR